MVIGNTVPAPPFEKNGSIAFRKNDFVPVTICESFACIFKFPRISILRAATS